MQALSLQQPWASLIVTHAKRIETRSWAPRGLRVGEQFAIHASKGFPQEARDLFWSSTFRDALALADIRNPRDLPLGAIVAIVRLGKVLSTNTPLAISERERAFGNYTPNRYAWVLTDVQPLLRPIAARGALGLWEWQAPSNLGEYLHGPTRAMLSGGVAR